MTKKEMIDVLINEYGVEDKGLMKKTAKELREMLEEYKKLGETEIVEEDTVSVDREEADEGYKEEVVTELQPKIHEIVVRRFEPARDLRIENLGAGDVFVSRDRDKLVRKENKLSPKESKDMKNISALYITSASRPIVRIIY
mgnify:FL=1